MAKINVPGFKIGTKEDISKLTGMTVIPCTKRRGNGGGRCTRMGSGNKGD